jgi:SAM-dependent methyltransferase
MNQSLSKNEQEERLRQLAEQGDARGIQRLLESTVTGFDINSPDDKGCSALFIALANGQAKKNPPVISILLTHGAVVKNGNILPPTQMPKLLTQHANAQILRQVAGYCFQPNGTSLLRDHDLVLEVGSGNGYLKYLLSSIHPQQPLIENIKDRLVETELSADIVYNSGLKGKHLINKGISQLPDHFGEAFTSRVISLNVMDTFTLEELIANMGCIYRLLKPGGLFLHIMSSSIHPHVFAEIKKIHRDSMLFPYYENSKLGLRVGILNERLELLLKSLPSFTGDWCDLFMKNPQQYIEIANTVTGIFNDTGAAGTVILFRDFFIEKIKKVFERTGFRSLYREEIEASQVVPLNAFHQQIPGTNYFENNLGLIITDIFSDINQRHGTSKVVEKAVFLVIIGQRD